MRDDRANDGDRGSPAIGSTRLATAPLTARRMQRSGQGARRSALRVTQLALMAHAQNANVLGLANVTVQRDETILAARDHELSQIVVHGPTDQRMVRKNRDRLADRSDVFTRTCGVFGVEVTDPFEIAERRWQDDYFRHVFGLGRLATLPSVLAVK